MDTKARMSAHFKPIEIKIEVAQLTLDCAVNLLTSAMQMDCDGDDANCAPVTLLICAVTVATRPVGDVHQLYTRLFEVGVMVKAVESLAATSLHPHRRGLLACVLTLCEAGRKVADCGFGLANDQIWPEQMLNLLMPFMPDQVERLGERIRAERARREITEVQHG